MPIRIVLGLLGLGTSSCDSNGEAVLTTENGRVGAESGHRQAISLANRKSEDRGNSPPGTKRPSEGCVVRIILTVILFASALGLALNRGFYAETMGSQYLSLALFSAIIVLAMVRRSWLDLFCVLGGSALLCVVDYRVLGFTPLAMAGFSFVGFAAFAILGVHSIWAKGEDRQLLLYAFVPLSLFVGSEWVATTLLDITERLHPKTFDLFLYAFDSSLRVQISFLTGQLLLKFAWLRLACIFFYIALPLPLALVYAAQLRVSRSRARTAMIAFLVTGPLGILCYNMLPACGPVHLFGRAFPFHPLSTASALSMPVVPVEIRGARNAIPSLHMTWVLLIWWNAKNLRRWIRAIALSFVWATVLATMGTGEHYFVDLVVAFPFSLTVQALSSLSLPFGSRARRAAILFGTFATLLWLGLLSFATPIFWLSALMPWAMVAATVSLSVVLCNRLLDSMNAKESMPQLASGIPQARAHGAAG